MQPHLPTTFKINSNIVPNLDKLNFTQHEIYKDLQLHHHLMLDTNSNTILLCQNQVSKLTPKFINSHFLLLLSPFIPHFHNAYQQKNTLAMFSSIAHKVSLQGESHHSPKITCKNIGPKNTAPNQHLWGRLNVTTKEYTITRSTMRLEKVRAQIEESHNIRSKPHHNKEHQQDTPTQGPYTHHQSLTPISKWNWRMCLQS